MDRDRDIGISHIALQHAHLTLDIGDRDSEVSQFSLDLECDLLILRLIVLLEIAVIFRLEDLQLVLERAISRSDIIYAGILGTQCADPLCGAYE